MKKDAKPFSLVEFLNEFNKNNSKQIYANGYGVEFFEEGELIFLDCPVPGYTDDVELMDCKFATDLFTEQRFRKKIFSPRSPGDLEAITPLYLAELFNRGIVHVFCQIQVKGTLRDMLRIQMVNGKLKAFEKEGEEILVVPVALKTANDFVAFTIKHIMKIIDDE